MKRFRYLFVPVVACVMMLSGCEKDTPPVDGYSSLQEVSRLELARMTVGKVGKISDPLVSDAHGFAGKFQAVVDAMKIGTRIGVYSYDTYLVAYLDLTKLSPEDVEVNEESHIAKVILPPVEIVTDGRDPRLHEEHYRVTGLRSSISPAERAALKSQMAAEVKKELASDKGNKEALRKEAEMKARAWFAALLSDWGYEAEIEFKD